MTNYMCTHVACCTVCLMSRSVHILDWETSHTTFTRTDQGAVAVACDPRNSKLRYERGPRPWGGGDGDKVCLGLCQCEKTVVWG